MLYRYSDDRDFSDYACGGAIKGRAGMPNFPARLALEIYARAASHLDDGAGVVLYDPLCGSGYLLTVVALLAARCPAAAFGSDVNEGALELARANLSLLTPEGRSRRAEELALSWETYGRESYRLALDSLGRIAAQADGRKVDTRVTLHDVLSTQRPDLPALPNLILTDVPYGGLVSWQGEGGEARLMQCLARKAAPGAVFAVCMDKRQRLCADGFTRLEKEQIGKRRFEIYRRESA